MRRELRPDRIAGIDRFVGELEVQDMLGEGLRPVDPGDPCPGKRALTSADGNERLLSGTAIID